MQMTFEEYWSSLVDDSADDPKMVAACKYAAQKAWDAATKAERAACAELADEIAYGPYDLPGHEIGTAIRARNDA